MQPSKANVADFLAFVPGVDAGTAFLFLENANSVNDAVNQYYDNPHKYARRPPSSMSSLRSPITPVSPTFTAMTRNSSSPTAEPTRLASSPPLYPSPPSSTVSGSVNGSQPKAHTNTVIEAARLRARDEQEMQNMLQAVQLSLQIYNPEIEPERECGYPCNCLIHKYVQRKMERLHVQDVWSKAVMYPGEKHYHDCTQVRLFNNNPYQSVVSPYGFSGSSFYGIQRPDPQYHAKFVHQTIHTNDSLNAKARAAIDAMEPSFNIWEVDQLQSSMSNIGIGPSKKGDHSGEKSKRSTLKKALSIRSSEEKVASKTSKIFSEARELCDSILREENGRWPEPEDRQIVTAYQEQVGLTQKIAELRTRCPLQYLHLLKAGYFEPIPIAWARQASNPLKFTIDAAAGWRGITPAWRGYEDTAEERLYWVLNHRLGDTPAKLKPDPISALELARARMALAVEPPPIYYAADDTCHVQHTSQGYSRQVMPPPFRPFDAPHQPTDDTMILLDVSGSMDFQPRRPEYNQFLITGFTRSPQPKNKDLAQAVIRRFTDAMSNHDHNWSGYELTTFSSQAEYIGVINHWNFEEMWRTIQFGGRTRVMTGWQSIKEQHFQKHAATATHHPTYGWQAGPETPILRLLLLLDGEASDMDEFELDLLSLPWVHVTIFLIGVDGCPHHHRHANELQRISEVNPHVSFVDAQGNTPERFITHELLKRHLGYELSMTEFEELEHAPGEPRRVELPAREPPPPNLPELEQPPPPLPVELPADAAVFPSRLSMEQPPPYSATA
ncbi:uncharacterized protein N7496_000180 [Penicillium cataractarum]|uniref:VWFA domain-containing protein n=1 Tax=Penicillium cataractarum TaxID=2100454 RepID=A0A9W9VTG7_9EURO|nr:uncharacterized protein N7496_000180 [Penicillium cataractarum]KAJ5389112.1 hypothetical protein N7496_000180 [Penicillium cataractarum]